MSKEKRSAGNEVRGDSILLTKEVIPCNSLEDSAGDSWRNTDTLKNRQAKLDSFPIYYDDINMK